MAPKAILNPPKFWSHSSTLILPEVCSACCIGIFTLDLSVLHALNLTLLHKSPLDSGPARAKLTVMPQWAARRLILLSLRPRLWA